MRKSFEVAVMYSLGCVVTAQAAHAQAFSMREVTVKGHKKVVVEHFSPDIAKSEKEGFFLGRVSVQPKEFLWNHHHVEIRECWLERTDTTDDNEVQLNISFTIDGKQDKEHRIAHKRHEHLELREETEQQSIKRISFFNYLPPSRYWRLPIGAYGNYVHYAQLRIPISENLKLRVGATTCHDRSKDPSPDLEEWSDTVIDIDLTEHKSINTESRPHAAKMDRER